MRKETQIIDSKRSCALPFPFLNRRETRGQVQLIEFDNPEMLVFARIGVALDFT